ncbi:hypothetical protein QTP70_012299 [Hemibagrus guttatus]|uniref:SGNH hydrolase-type esterase domain-containing protein n=1 Tax=Hemibagrus guttatus TaxID=175788 RepID=A0AAE0R4G7_9TELE|nr:hypothetical protein QTP70_012299 [Hemibagrus guttatus]
MGVEVPQQNYGVPSRSTFQHPLQGLQEGWVLHTAIQPISRNNSETPIPGPKLGDIPCPKSQILCPGFGSSGPLPICSFLQVVGLWKSGPTSFLWSVPGRIPQAKTRPPGEDSFELHSVDLELEAMEKQIRDLQVKQAQLRQRKATLESSWTNTHLSQVSFTLAPGYHEAWMQQQRKTRAKPRARTSPPPSPLVFEISTQNHFAPLQKTECDAVIIGDPIVRHGRATTAKGKLPAILKKNFGAVVLHAGTNDIRLRQTEILKKDFRSLVEKVRTTLPTMRIIVSGPLPTFQRGIEKFSRLFAFNEWLYRPDGLHPSRVGAAVLSDNISRTLRTI